MPRRVLLFDLDGTLVDSARGIAAALNLLRAERGGAPRPVEDVRPLVALGAETLVAAGLGALAGNAQDDLAAFRRHLAEVPADPAALYPGVSETLEALAGAGWRMGLVTNKPEALARALLADLHLARHFGAIVGGDTAAFPKPSPAPVRRALALLGADAALFVGDSAIDAAAARACAIVGGDTAASPKPSPAPVRHALALLGADTALFVGDSGIDAAAARACAIPFLLFAGGYGAADCAPEDVAARFDRFEDLPALVAAL